MKIYKNIMDKVPEYEEKRGIIYATVNGRLYKTLNVFYILFFAFTAFINSAVLIGFSFDMEKTEYKDAFYKMLILTAVLIVAFVLTFFKKHFAFLLSAFALQTTAGAWICVWLTEFTEKPEGGLRFSYYWRHLIPICVLTLLLGWLAVIALRAAVKRRKSYKKIFENIYNQNKKGSDGENISDSAFEDILNDYE